MEPALFSVLSGLVLWGVVFAVVVLSARPRPGSDPRTVADSAGRYGRRLGLVALVAAFTLSGAVQPQSAQWWEGDFGWGAFTQLGIPALTAMAVMAVGELAWPRPRSARHPAMLKPRRVRGYVPGYMAAVFAGAFLLNLLFLSAALIRPVPRDLSFVAGWAAWLAVSAAGTVLLLYLVAARPAIAGATAGTDAAVRRASAHRVLRLGAALSLLQLQAFHDAFSAGPPAPADASGFSLASLAALLSTVGLFALLVRAPEVPLPKADSGDGPLDGLPDSERFAGAVSAVSRSLRTGLAAPVTGAAAAAAVLSVTGADAATDWVGALVAAAGTYLAVCILAEILLVRALRQPGNRNALLPGSVRAFVSPPRWQVLTAAAAGVAVLALQILCAVAARSMEAALSRSGGQNLHPGWFPEDFFNWKFSVLSAAAVILVPAASALLARITLRRAPLRSAPTTDARLRRISLSRAARTAAAANLAVLAAGAFRLGSATVAVPLQGTALPVPLDWIHRLADSAVGASMLLMTAALLIALPLFGPSHFEGAPDPEFPDAPSAGEAGKPGSRATRR